MDPGHTDIVDPVDRVAQVLEDQRRFLGHRKIGGPGRHHADRRSPPVRSPAATSRMLPDGVVPQLVESSEQASARSCSRRVTSTLPWCVETPFDDTRKLLVGLAGGEDHLGHAGSSFTVGVEPRKTEIVDSLGAQAFDGVVDTEPTGGDRFQYFLNFVPVQRSSIGVHTCSVTAGRPNRQCTRPQGRFSTKLRGIVSLSDRTQALVLRQPLIVEAFE